jgi:hypothetical protein
VASPYPPGVWGPYLLEPGEPERPERGWDLLGYDVADGAWFCGLSNCAYTPDEPVTLRESWAPELNEHHLFHDREPAFGFVEVTNARVPEHAPFHVYGLYRVRQPPRRAPTLESVVLRSAGGRRGLRWWSG